MINDFSKLGYEFLSPHDDIAAGQQTRAGLATGLLRLGGGNLVAHLHHVGLQC